MRRGGRIAHYLNKALRGEIVISEAIRARSGHASPSSAFSIVPEVLIDNSISADCTVIEASGLDREGLLFELTNAISKLNLNIVSAQVTTFGERAVDTFYVKDLTGDKILSPWRQGTIRRNLIEAFAAPADKRTARGTAPQRSGSAPAS